MTSVLNNGAAISALRVLQNTNNQLEATQNRISTGLKIGEAKDNAAYWSIATTLKSDTKAMSTVKDALGLGAATVETAYNGLNAAKDVLDEIKSKLTAATQNGVDRSKIQGEISELQKQLVSIAGSSVFSGENWLSVDSDAAGYSAAKNVVASFTRDASNTVSIGTIGIDTSTMRLYDSGAGTGILDAAVNLTGVTVGGSNSTLGATAGGLKAGSGAAGNATAAATTAYLDTNTALVFDNVADVINLQVNINGAGAETVEIRRGTVQTALNDSSSSVSIASADDLAKVVNQALADAGVTNVTAKIDGAGLLSFTNTATGATDNNIVITATATDHDTTNGTLSGAASEFLATDFGTAAATYGKAKVEMDAFVGPVEFLTADDEIEFSIGKDGAAAVVVTIDKDTVSAALGSTDGKINSAAEFQQVVIQALADASVTGVTVGSLANGKVTFTRDATAIGSAVAISAVSTAGFTGTAGTTPSISVKDIDISAAKLTERGADTGAEVQATITAYIGVVSQAIEKITTAASTLGAVAKRIDLQEAFVTSLMDTIDKGVSGLVDADMNEESTRLQALQVQQQLGVQALSIANQSAQNVLRLFQ